MKKKMEYNLTFIFRLSNKAQLTINNDLTLVETVTSPSFIAEPRSQTVVNGTFSLSVCIYV